MDTMAFELFRLSNNQWNATAGPEDLGNAYEGYWVDFDKLPAQFVVLFAGNCGNGAQSGRIRLRIGGTYNTVDGTVTLDQTYSTSGGFQFFAVSQTITNIWTGIQLVKLTGQTAFAQRPSLFIYPVGGTVRPGKPALLLSFNGTLPSALSTTLTPTYIAGIIVDEAVIGTPRRLRIGGVITGPGSVTIQVRTGGTVTGADGTLVTTLAPITSPQTPFVVEAGFVSLTGLTRLKLLYTCTDAFSVANFFWMLY